MHILEVMKERVQDIVALSNNSVPVKQIKYREKLRTLSETDIMCSLHQFRKLTQQDLATFQEGSKLILRIIVPGFEATFNDLTLTGTSRMFIELYNYCGFSQRSEQLYNELLHNSKQQIFLCLIQHLLEITKMAMQTAIKRFIDMKLFCVGKEIEKSAQLIQMSTRKPDYYSDISPSKRRPIPVRVQRSESNVIQDSQQECKVAILRREVKHSRAELKQIVIRGEIKETSTKDVTPMSNLSKQIYFKIDTTDKSNKIVNSEGSTGNNNQNTNQIVNSANTVTSVNTVNTVKVSHIKASSELPRIHQSPMKSSRLLEESKMPTQMNSFRSSKQSEINPQNLPNISTSQVKYQSMQLLRSLRIRNQNINTTIQEYLKQIQEMQSKQQIDDKTSQL